MGDIEKRNRRLPWRRGDRRARVYRPGPFALVYSSLLAAGLVAATGVYYVLVHHVPGMAANRADTMKTALLVIGGSGALAGLYVAYRKQRTDEANHLRDQDKLFTERYTAAVAQLGNTTSAAIRLGGVYALARIADDSERDRPTCLKVLCAYLRMPYDPDDPQFEPAEREVRVAAQTALTERLRTDHPGFWADAEIDLRGAYLVESWFGDVTVASFSAAKATFSGGAGFNGATFSQEAGFIGATFSGDAGFYRATFSGHAWFEAATFNWGAEFDKATFSGSHAGFSRATFSQDARFIGATFSGDAGFIGAMFSRDARFDDATFSGGARFIGATFRRDHPPVWPDGFAEPAGIVWTDPPSADPDPGPPSDPADLPSAPRLSRISTRIMELMRL